MIWAYFRCLLTGLRQGIVPFLEYMLNILLASYAIGSIAFLIGVNINEFAYANAVFLATFVIQVVSIVILWQILRLFVTLQTIDLKTFFLHQSHVPGALVALFRHSKILRKIIRIFRLSSKKGSYNMRSMQEIGFNMNFLNNNECLKFLICC